MQHLDATLDLTDIVRNQRARVRRVLRARGVAERDLPDAEQEVFLVVHRKLVDFEGRSSLSTWVQRIALNVASEHRRKARHRYELLDGGTAPEASTTDPAARLEARDALERVRAAIDDLSHEQREAFLLHELVGLSMHEVAERLHVPLKTAFSRLYAARRGLTAALARSGIAIAALMSGVLLWRPARGCARASFRAAHLPLGSVALMCSVLPAFAPALTAPRPVSVAPLAAVAAVAHMPVPQRAEPSARVAARPSSAASAPTATVTATAPRRRSKTGAPRHAPPTPMNATVRVPIDDTPVIDAREADDMVVTRSGALDLRPQLEHPFAARVAVHDAPARIALRGPRDAANALEESLAGSQLP